MDSFDSITDTYSSLIRIGRALLDSYDEIMSDTDTPNVDKIVIIMALDDWEDQVKSYNSKVVSFNHRVANHLSDIDNNVLYPNLSSEDQKSFEAWYENWYHSHPLETL